MELTLNLKVKDWYENTTENDLAYWGIDYPPLSAYQSWISGKFLSAFDPDAVALYSSRGYENEASKLGMRLSVVVSDLLVYIPACVAWVSTIPELAKRLFVLTWMLCNPGLLIVDHGHFQYNGIGLGLTVAAVYCISRKMYLSGSFLYCAALNHKQMTLYFAPAIFAHLLGKCLQQKGMQGKARLFTSLGTVVLLSFLLFWSPFLLPVRSALQVLKRILPVQRGLFEDYVANFWCVSSLVFKWKRYFSGPTLAKLCAATTIFACLPSLSMEISRPSTKTFTLCLANTSLCFFLFSYMVHEKSILMPLVPMSMLCSHQGDVSSISTFFISLLTMYPLLKKDGLVIAYWALQILIIAFQCLTREDFWPKRSMYSSITSFIKGLLYSPGVIFLGVLCVHTFCYLIQPFSSKEYISDAVMMVAGFGFYTCQLVLSIQKQYSLWKQQ